TSKTAAPKLSLPSARPGRTTTSAKPSRSAMPISKLVARWRASGATTSHARSSSALTGAVVGATGHALPRLDRAAVAMLTHFERARVDDALVDSPALLVHGRR